MLVLIALLSCANDPVERTTTNNPDVPVDLLFTKDGCTVYRFEDGGRSHYFAKCESPSSTSTTESCGKNCTRTVEVPTALEQ